MDAQMTKKELKKLIDIAAGRIPADLIIRNCRIVDVYGGEITQGDVAVSDGWIAGVGCYEGREVVDAGGRYLAPGLIDSHIHIESSYVTPEEIGRLLVPHGATTIIADPHEIVNVCGMTGMEYMMAAAQRTPLRIHYMLPSCVPATSFEHAGARLDAEDMAEPMKDDRVLGMGEFMSFPGVVAGADPELDKIMEAKKSKKTIDGHSPGLSGMALNAYAAALIHTDHECSTIAEMQERISRGMYVLMRQGSACRDLRALLPGLTQANSRRCLLCSDDRQPKTIFEEGHLDNHLSICVEMGVDPVTAIQMATINAAECFRLYDRGGIAPGLRADLVLFDDLHSFHVNRVWIGGHLEAREGRFLSEVHREDALSVRHTIRVKDFSVDKLRMHLQSDQVRVIDILPDGVVTGKSVAKVHLDDTGNFVWDPKRDIVKMAVVERHQMTGKVATAFLGGYGIRQGAVALSVAHDSHNIITVGVSDEEMAAAVEALIAQDGGIVLVKDGRAIAGMPMPIGGVMTDQSGEWVDRKLKEIHQIARDELGISGDVEPVMTLCFMSLAVIPKLKLTDMGLFDVEKFAFVPVEA